MNNKKTTQLCVVFLLLPDVPNNYIILIVLKSPLIPLYKRGQEN